MIICTGDNFLRQYRDCSDWEKACLKERLWQGCDFTYDLPEEEQNYIESCNSSMEISDDFAEKAFGSTWWADEDFLR